MPDSCAHEFNLSKKTVVIKYNNLAGKSETPEIKITDICITDEEFKTEPKKTAGSEVNKPTAKTTETPEATEATGATGETEESQTEKQQTGGKNGKSKTKNKNDTSTSSSPEKYISMCE